MSFPEAAVASAPAPIAREKWLAEILGESHAFASGEEEKEITQLLTRFAEDTARQLDEGEGFDLILYGPEGEEVFPFLALTGEAKQMALDAGEAWMSEDEEQELLAEIRKDFADHLIDVRRYWFDKGRPQTVKREGPKIGRNDPCPCGSGKKYKSCHGR